MHTPLILADPLPPQTEIIADYQINKKDVGSAPVQIALLTRRIVHLTRYMSNNKQDFHSRRGLENLVSQRRKLQKYYRKKHPQEYVQLIAKLGLRK